ncbi:hypothetical protein [Rhizobium leguminosarum]|uniref:hypothetical protein n=1 Tax=Rhizobium leguminosarum TaxID=384 RepID=UPI003F967298
MSLHDFKDVPLVWNYSHLITERMLEGRTKASVAMMLPPLKTVASYLRYAKENDRVIQKTDYLDLQNLIEFYSDFPNNHKKYQETQFFRAFVHVISSGQSTLPFFSREVRRHG